MKYIKEIRFMLDLFIGLSVPALYVIHAKKKIHHALWTRLKKTTVILSCRSVKKKWLIYLTTPMRDNWIWETNDQCSVILLLCHLMDLPLYWNFYFLTYNSVLWSLCCWKQVTIVISTRFTTCVTVYSVGV